MHTCSYSRADEELAFLSATNDEQLFNGWRRHRELFRALRDPNTRSHAELADSLQRFTNAKPPSDEFVVNAVLIPLGKYDLLPFGLFTWDVSHRGYRGSAQFKAHMRKIGAEEYWREYGFSGAVPRDWRR